MKTCTCCGKSKPLDGFHRMTSKTTALRPACKDCTKAANAAYRKANRESVLAQKREYAERNRESEYARRNAWREVNREREKAQQRQYRKANREMLAEYLKDYAKKNPWKIHAISMKRRISKKRQTPVWADLRKIEEIYEFANEFRQAGFDVHVDHIIPLNGKLVSGFHVESNLRVCLAKHNLQKSNNFSVEV